MNDKDYWTKLYGFRSKEFIEGVMAGIEACAIWEDGKMVVGISKEPLMEAMDIAKQGLGWPEIR